MYKKYSHHSEKKTMETRIIKNIFNKYERRCREQGWEANIGPKIKQTTSISTYISTALCILLYSGVSTYVGLYGSGLFNFGSYVSLPPCSHAFWVLTSLHLLSYLLKMFFIILL